MSMLPPAEYERLSALGQQLRAGLADLLETQGIPWQVTGQGSLFKLHPHPRTLVDYRSALPRPEEQQAMERFSLAMFGEGIILTPELAGCLSTVMNSTEVETLVSAADRAFSSIGR
jgi:glutamate-1-semialdehyde 2,1-aminomutase